MTILSLKQACDVTVETFSSSEQKLDLNGLFHILLERDVHIPADMPHMGKRKHADFLVLLTLVFMDCLQFVMNSTSTSFTS